MNQSYTETLEICQDDYEELFRELERWMQEQEDNELMMTIADDYEVNQERDEVDEYILVEPMIENDNNNEIDSHK